jgi:hypothetical protein
LTGALLPKSYSGATFGATAISAPKVMEGKDGKSAIVLLLYSLCGISLLIFGFGLCCLAIRHPYIIAPITFAGAILFSVMAFRCKPRKETGKNNATKCNHPNTCFVAFETFKNSIYKILKPKGNTQDKKETKKRSQNTNDCKGNKTTSRHSTPPRGKS